MNIKFTSNNLLQSQWKLRNTFLLADLVYQSVSSVRQTPWRIQWLSCSLMSRSGISVCVKCEADSLKNPMTFMFSYVQIWYISLCQVWGRLLEESNDFHALLCPDPVYQSVSSVRQTPWRIQWLSCSLMSRSARNTRPTPNAFLRWEVVYTGVRRVFCREKCSELN